MKFILPLQKTKMFFREWHAFRGTWEYRLSSIAVLGQLLICGITVFWFWRQLPPKVPIWYSRPWGEERLDSPLFLLLPPLTALLVFVINHAMLTRSASDQPMFGRVLSLTSVLVSTLSAIVVIRIVTLVT